MLVKTARVALFLDKRYGVNNLFSLSSLKVATVSWIQEVWAIFWTLVKVMVPVLIAVRIIDLMGWIEVLAQFIEPLMQWLGLPGEMGLVWMSAMLSNIYTGMAVFYQLEAAESLTIADVSVLASLMLLAHSLPIEVAVAKASGVGVMFTLVLRIGSALILGVILNQVYSYWALLQTPLPTVWQPEAMNSDWMHWLIAQGQIILAAFFIIAALTLLIRLLRVLGIEKLIHFLLAPVLRALGIGAKATNILVVGLSLGLTFGGGLLIHEARSGKIDARDIFMTMAFLGLCHSLIEDTLLTLLLGADLSAILWARIVFSVVVIALLSRLLKSLPQGQRRWFYRDS